MIYILAPDKPAGEDFKRVMKENGVDAHLIHHKTAARVVANENGANAINPKPEKVAGDLAKGIEKIIKIDKEFGSKKPIIAISCNTASLPVFIDKTLSILKNEGFQRDSDFIDCDAGSTVS